MLYDGGWPRCGHGEPTAGRLGVLHLAERRQPRHLARAGGTPPIWSSGTWQAPRAVASSLRIDATWSSTPPTTSPSGPPTPSSPDPASGRPRGTRRPRRGLARLHSPPRRGIGTHDPSEFIAKWQASPTRERTACQPHFLDLCRLLGIDDPADADPDARVVHLREGREQDAGGEGWADVWMQAASAGNTRASTRTSTAAYDQLLRYADALENPPLLIVCDLDRSEIHTNFTNTVQEVHAFTWTTSATPRSATSSSAAFADPEKLRPGKTRTRSPPRPPPSSPPSRRACATRPRRPRPSPTSSTS